MLFLKDHRRPAHWVRGAFFFAVLTVTACEWITPLDFGGNSNQPSDAGDDECNNGCPNNLICKGGKCTCAADQTECSGICVNSLEDAGYCGACGVTCRADQICSGGNCGCKQGENECGASCVDLNTDSQHCGACANACPSGQSCLDGTCKSSPCDGLCASPNIVSASNDSTGYRFDTLGSAELCIAIENYVPTATNPRIVCWNLDTTLRPLQVDGQAVPCETGDGYALPQQSSGWYCVQVGAGTDNSSGLLLPTL